MTRADHFLRVAVLERIEVFDFARAMVSPLVNDIDRAYLL
jgi:hypothetical protein